MCCISIYIIYRYVILRSICELRLYHKYNSVRNNFSIQIVTLVLRSIRSRDSEFSPLFGSFFIIIKWLTFSLEGVDSPHINKTMGGQKLSFHFFYSASSYPLPLDTSFTLGFMRFDLFNLHWHLLCLQLSSWSEWLIDLIYLLNTLFDSYTAVQNSFSAFPLFIFHTSIVCFLVFWNKLSYYWKH